MNDAKDEQTWIFTFGADHMHEGFYVTFSGTYESAREKMIAKYGTQFCWQYSEDEWSEVVERLGPMAETELKQAEEE